MRGPLIALALLIAGCATGPELTPPELALPDLRGTWTGTWGGTPLRVIVLEQKEGPGDASLMIGPWQVLGEQYPLVRGVMTCTVRGEPISTATAGLVGQSGRRLIVAFRARSSAGDLRLTLRLVDADRLEGTGESQFGWGPQGAVQLAREPQSPAAGTGAPGWRFRS